MAAELAKVSLWLEALEPGKPLAFLDANIRVGNALLGTTPALLAQGIPDEAFTALTGDDKTVVTALRKRNKAEREQLATGHEQLDMFEATGLPVDNTRLAWHANALRQLATGSLADVHFAQQRLKALEDDPRRRHAQLMADAWCAAFMQPKTTDTAGDVVTTRVLRRIADADPERITAEEQEELFDLGDPGGPIVPPEMRDTIAEQANRYRFFHWHLEFPHIFPVPEDPTPGQRRRAGKAGSPASSATRRGSECKLQEKEFFAESRTRDRGRANAAATQAAHRGLPRLPAARCTRTTSSSSRRGRGREPVLPRRPGGTHCVRGQDSTPTRSSPRPSATSSARTGGQASSPRPAWRRTRRPRRSSPTR